MMMQQRVDWKLEAARVAEMTECAINAELSALHGALETADAMDRDTGNDRGGYYRDLCSVLRAELKRRGPRVCRRCGR